MPTIQTVCYVGIFCQWINGKDQIDYYQNVGTKLTVTLKCRDQNGVFALYIYIFGGKLSVWPSPLCYK